jgi:hypothetical protein
MVDRGQTFELCGKYYNHKNLFVLRISPKSQPANYFGVIRFDRTRNNQRQINPIVFASLVNDVVCVNFYPKFVKSRVTLKLK